MLSFRAKALSSMFIFFALCSSSWLNAAEIVPKNYNNLPVIILKVDDLKNYKLDVLTQQEVAWDRFISFVKANKMKANAGALGDQFDTYNAVDVEFYEDLKRDFLGSGVMELFNHSFCFCPEAFDSGSSYSSQYSVLNNTQAAVKKAIGVTMIGFGSGGNRKTSDTVKVMNSHPDMKVWFFGRPEMNGIELDTSKVLNLSREYLYSDIDDITSTSVFLSNFEKVKGNPFMVYQGHPGKWNNTQLNNFKSAMSALLAKYPKLKFMTISEYYNYVTGGSAAPVVASPPNPPSNIEIKAY